MLYVAAVFVRRRLPAVLVDSSRRSPRGCTPPHPSPHPPSSSPFHPSPPPRARTHTQSRGRSPPFASLTAAAFTGCALKPIWSTGVALRRLGPHAELHGTAVLIDAGRLFGRFSGTSSVSSRSLRRLSIIWTRKAHPRTRRLVDCSGRVSQLVTVRPHQPMPHSHHTASIEALPACLPALAAAAHQGRTRAGREMRRGPVALWQLMPPRRRFGLAWQHW